MHDYSGLLSAFSHKSSAKIMLHAQSASTLKAQQDFPHRYSDYSQLMNGSGSLVNTAINKKLAFENARQFYLS